MRYCSTRGGTRGWDFRQVLFSGYAPDGGMFMPESLPGLSADTLRSWASLSYSELVLEVCALFIPDDLIPRHDLADLLSQALSQFSVPGAVRLVQLRDGLCVLELFHGQTMAFKDLAMTCVTRLLDYFLRREHRRATILVGTSGDTGGSAICSARGLHGVDVLVVFPLGRITAVQERHMTTSLEDNVHVFAADGSSDDIDVPLRRLFADQDLVKNHGLMSLNSVNWARILVQLAHYLYAYLHLSDLQKVKGQELPTVEVVVPTGGAGNIAAGCIVSLMGVPLRLVAMVNDNDIVHRAVQSGDYSMASSVKQTLAPAIDIQDPYNMERVLWLLSDKNSTLVKDLMEEFQSSRRLQLPEKLHKKRHCIDAKLEQLKILRQITPKLKRRHSVAANGREVVCVAQGAKPLILDQMPGLSRRVITIGPSSDLQKVKGQELPTVKVVVPTGGAGNIAGSVTDEEIIGTMQRCWQENHYLLCPHSAVAAWYHYHASSLGPGVSRCCIATASPAKFQEAVQKAGLTLDLPKELRALEEMETRYEKLEKGTDWEARLKERIRAIRCARQKGQLFHSANNGYVSNTF